MAIKNLCYSCGEYVKFREESRGRMVCSCGAIYKVCPKGYVFSTSIFGKASKYMPVFINYCRHCLESAFNRSEWDSEKQMHKDCVKELSPSCIKCGHLKTNGEGSKFWGRCQDCEDKFCEEIEAKNKALCFKAWED